MPAIIISINCYTIGTHCHGMAKKINKYKDKKGGKKFAYNIDYKEQLRKIINKLFRLNKIIIYNAPAKKNKKQKTLDQQQ